MHTDGFGKRRSGPASAAEPVAKPLKRPRQARAVFTVEAIYQALVRIWLRQGWGAVTTRSVALEAGVAVGTLYDYFPSKQALLSGYVRYNLEQLRLSIEQQLIVPSDLSWRQRISGLIQLSCAQPNNPMFSLDTWRLEPVIAEPKHQKRAFEELSQCWLQVLKACHDLPCPATLELAQALFMMAWGARRYSVLAQLSASAQQAWIVRMEQAFVALIEAS